MNLSDLVKRRRKLVVPISSQGGLEFLDFAVRLPGAIPQIIVFHKQSLGT